MGWRGFHEEGTKEVHYALAWSVVYFLLTEYLDADLPLRTRVRQLYETDPEEICRLEGRWKAFVISLHLTEKLEELAGLRPGANDKDEDSGGDGEATASTKLTACWAIDQLGTQRYLDRRRALRALERGFELEDPEARRHAYLAFARLSADLSATSSRADLTDIRGVMERGADRIDRVIADPDSPPELRQQLVATVARNLPRQQRWLPVFIRLLDAPESEIRVEAARGLGRALVKRTVINPSFWRAGSPSERRKEIDEWEDWWSSQPIEARQ
jgi:hypothetical protein